MAMEPTSTAPPRRAELLAATSLAIDLGLGQPMEHMLRSCLIAMRLADAVAAGAEQRETAYYAGLLAWIGCHADSQEFAELLGDDIAFRAASYDVDWRGPAYAALLARFVGSGRPLPAHVARLGSFAMHAQAQLTALIDSHCRSASVLADRLGLPAGVTAGLAFTFERFDGSGLPAGASGEAIPLGMRIAHIADVAEVHARRGGRDAAIETVRARSGTQFDPALVTAFVAEADRLLRDDGDAWEQVLALAPASDRTLGDEEFDAVLAAMGDFVDLKSPWTVGHSRAVAALAGAAASALGLPPSEVRALTRAGHVLDLGRMGVPNRVWGKRSALSAAEQEHVRLHPYLSRRILTRVPALRGIARAAGSHHERLDGSGYPQGATATELGMPERILAAADEYRSLQERHPARPALDPSEAAGAVRAQVRSGSLDGPAVEALLAAVGERRVRRSWPAGLTAREVEVLRLIAQGETAAGVGRALHITPKTARNHVEHIYAKLGTSNRTGAALFAVSHGLLDVPSV